MHTTYEPHELKLAQEIAAALNDRDSLTLHLQYVRRYEESFLRTILTKVLSIPPEQIKRSRAALYVFLVNRNSSDESIRD